MLSYLFNKFEEMLIAFLLAAMTLITFAQVVTRYLNSKFWASDYGVELLEKFPALHLFADFHMVWALEVTQYLFAWLVLLGMSYGVKVGAHIGIDSFTRLFTEKWQKIFAILAASLCIVYCIILFIGGSQYVYKIYQIGIQTENLPIKQWIPYSVLPIGLLLLAFRFIQVIVKIIQGNKVTLLADEARDAIEEHLKPESDIKK